MCAARVTSPTQQEQLIYSDIGADALAQSGWTTVAPKSNIDDEGTRGAMNDIVEGINQLLLVLLYSCRNLSPQRTRLSNRESCPARPQRRMQGRYQHTINDQDDLRVEIVMRGFWQRQQRSYMCWFRVPCPSILETVRYLCKTLNSSYSRNKIWFCGNSTTPSAPPSYQSPWPGAAAKPVTGSGNDPWCLARVYWW